MRGGSPAVPVLATRGRNRTGSTGGLGQDLLGKKFKPSGFFFLFAWNGSLCVLWEEGIQFAEPGKPLREIGNLVPTAPERKGSR